MGKEDTGDKYDSDSEQLAYADRVVVGTHGQLRKIRILPVLFVVPISDFRTRGSIRSSFIEQNKKLRASRFKDPNCKGSVTLAEEVCGPFAISLINFF